MLSFYKDLLFIGWFSLYAPPPSIFRTCITTLTLFPI
jgi:hypothetical protein